MIIPGDILEMILPIQFQKSAHAHIEYDDFAKASWNKEKSVCSIAVFRVRPEHRIYFAFSSRHLKMFHSITSGVHVYHRSG